MERVSDLPVSQGVSKPTELYGTPCRSNCTSLDRPAGAVGLFAGWQYLAAIWYVPDTGNSPANCPKKPAPDDKRDSTPESEVKSRLGANTIPLFADVVTGMVCEVHDAAHAGAADARTAVRDLANIFSEPSLYNRMSSKVQVPQSVKQFSCIRVHLLPTLRPRLYIGAVRSLVKCCSSLNQGCRQSRDPLFQNFLFEQRHGSVWSVPIHAKGYPPSRVCTAHINSVLFNSRGGVWRSPFET